MSILPKFYEQLFRKKVMLEALPYLKRGFIPLWRKKIGRKAALKMLVKLTDIVLQSGSWVLTFWSQNLCCGI